MSYGINIIGGEIGGVGKSTFAKIFLELYIKYKNPFFLVDADKTTPNVGLSYAKDEYTPEFLLSTSVSADPSYMAEGEAGKEVENLAKEVKMQRIVLGDSYDRTLELDHLTDLAASRDVVMVLPSQSWDQVSAWITINKMWADKKQAKYPTRYWFVSNGTDESMALVEKSIELLKIPHILCKNKGTDDFAKNWQRLEESARYTEIIQRLSLAGTCEFGMIPLMASERDAFRSRNQRFCDLEKALNPIKWDRVADFLDEAIKSIEATGQIILPSKASPKKPTPNN